MTAPFPNTAGDGRDRAMPSAALPPFGLSHSSVSQAKPAAAIAGNSCLPDTLPGHWATADGREMAETYAAKDRSELAMSHMTDLELANAVYMADRYDLALLAYQTAAKERIRWLSVKLAQAEAALAGKSA